VLEKSILLGVLPSNVPRELCNRLSIGLTYLLVVFTIITSLQTGPRARATGGYAAVGGVRAAVPGGRLFRDYGEGMRSIAHIVRSVATTQRTCSVGSFRGEASSKELLYSQIGSNPSKPLGPGRLLSAALPADAPGQEHPRPVGGPG